MLGTLLGAEDTVVRKAGSVLTLLELESSDGQGCRRGGESERSVFWAWTDACHSL